MARASLLAGAVLLCSLSAACSASHQSATGAAGNAATGGAGQSGAAGTDGVGGGFAGNGGAGAGNGGGGSAGNGGFAGSFATGPGAGGGAGSSDCDDMTKGSIYILGQDRQFVRFEPQTQMLTTLGTLACPGVGSFETTFSMSVDRQGVAWVLYQNGQVFHVDTKTVACSATGFAPCQAGFCTFGMGFVADAPGSSAETLYVSGVYNVSGGKGLAKIDAATMKLTAVADYDALPGQGAELTGTGDARLFGYFQDSPIHLAEIDKTSAHILSKTDLLEIPVGTSWAFAFWGGVFYIMSGTGIRKYDPATKVTTLINGNVGFNIVGAGVSTCAPTEEPK